MSEEATVNPDGSTTFEDAGAGDVPPTDEVPPVFEDAEETMEQVVAQGIDPAVYLLVSVIVAAILYYVLVYRKKTEQENDIFFSNLDGDKFNLKLPSDVDDYYTLKAKCEANGWTPGQGAAGKDGGVNGNPNGPSRMLAQALMKRAMADIPIVTHIQKESAGMNKLYSQSMCSVNQWRAYQAAEAMVSGEVEDVRAEADEVEPGWSQVIWRQAMQYHNVLKQKHEAEQKAAEEQAKKRKEIEQRVMEAKAADPDAKAKAAEKAAEELLKMEERENESKKSFAKGGMKKGFLDKGKGKKK